MSDSWFKIHVKKVGVTALSAFLFFSCSKHSTNIALTPALPVQTDSARVVVVPGKPLLIDSTSFVNATAAQNKAQLFYRHHAFLTQWLLDNQPSPLFTAFEKIVGDAEKYGLQSSDYDVHEIAQQVRLLYMDKVIEPGRITELDKHITDMFFRFTTHLCMGKITAVQGGRSIWKKNERIDRCLDVEIIKHVTTPEDLFSAVQQLQPEHEQYYKLQQALAYYRALEDSTPPAIDIVKGLKLKQDERHSIIPSIRKKLSLNDMHVYSMVYDTATASFDSLLYDAELVSAVKWFQVKHGLEPDGIIGERTLRFLNQSFSEKADIIALNMERLRWSRDKYGDDYIFVNIPDYTLKVYENRAPALEMRVIVGAVNKPTPVFSDVLQHIVFSPTWTVPTSIIREEIIPRLRNNATYYTDKNYVFYKNDEVIDPSLEVWDDTTNPYAYRVVQQPGPDNSLGLVKFHLSNDMSVYLHDTPNHRLFAKDYRALSHGCIRLDEPEKFAAYLLRDQRGWDAQRIEKAMRGNQPAGIPLKKKYEVHIEYFTAWVDENNMINFREDIYGHDKRQLQQLYSKEQTSDLAGL